MKYVLEDYTKNVIWWGGNKTVIGWNENLVGGEGKFLATGGFPLERQTVMKSK